VVNIVARARRVKTTGSVSTDSRFQLFLDEEEEVLHLTRIGELRRVNFPVDGFQRTGNGRSLRAVENAGFGQHDEMGAVDAAETVDMMGLGAVKKRAKHGFLVNRIG